MLSNKKNIIHYSSDKLLIIIAYDFIQHNSILHFVWFFQAL